MAPRFNGNLGFGRRDLIKAVGAAGIGLVATTACGSPTTKQATTAATNEPAATTTTVAASPSNPSLEKRPDSSDMTPDQALKFLMDGNQRFIDSKVIHPRGGMARVRDTSVDQFPYAAFLSCADSRVPVEEIFDQGIGDCFVCRVAGNVATPQDVGSLEFGTLVLGSRVLLVIGHERCGAVAASMGRIKLPANPGKIPSLVPLIQPAVKSIQEATAKKGVAAVGDDMDATIKLNVHNQVANLRTSPILSQLEKEGKLKIVPAYYDLDTGVVQVLKLAKA